MASGGKREGSGRKLGAISRGSKEARAKALASGIAPLDYMLKVMRDEGVEDERRDDMAKAAAPYVHSKRSTHEVSGNDAKPITVIHRVIIRANDQNG